MHHSPLKAVPNDRRTMEKCALCRRSSSPTSNPLPPLQSNVIDESRLGRVCLLNSLPPFLPFCAFICAAPLQLRRDLVLKWSPCWGFMCFEQRVGRGWAESDCESCIHMFSVLIYAIFLFIWLAFMLLLRIKTFSFTASRSRLAILKWVGKFLCVLKWMEKIKRGFIFFG